VADRTSTEGESTGNRDSGGQGDRWVELERRLEAPPDRVYRAWSDPEELPRWLPLGIEGSLAVGTRSSLIWADRRVWWEVVEALPDRRFVLRWPWLAGDGLVTTATITIDPRGYGSHLSVRDGPFPIDRPGVLDAWAAAIQTWTEAVTLLRAYVDFTVDLRPRR
jgi:uncharacterized protein YndB with AHSA1/START domain